MSKKFSIQLNVFTALLFTTVSVFSQTNREPLNENKIINPQCETEKNEAKSEWQEVKLDGFSFSLPKSFKNIEVKCYDSRCYRFEEGNTGLTIDRDHAAFRPNLERSYPDYRENIFDIDEGKVWSWFYKRDSKYKAGVLFYLNNPKDARLGIYLTSDDEQIFEIAEKIFNSVKFNPKFK
jgi:hypothetical protein